MYLHSIIEELKMINKINVPQQQCLWLVIITRALIFKALVGCRCAHCDYRTHRTHIEFYSPTFKLYYIFHKFYRSSIGDGQGRRRSTPSGFRYLLIRIIRSARFQYGIIFMAPMESGLAAVPPPPRRRCPQSGADYRYNYNFTSDQKSRLQLF